MSIQSWILCFLQSSLHLYCNSLVWLSKSIQNLKYRVRASKCSSCVRGRIQARVTCSRQVLVPLGYSFFLDFLISNVEMYSKSKTLLPCF